MQLVTRVRDKRIPVVAAARYPIVSQPQGSPNNLVYSVYGSSDKVSLSYVLNNNPDGSIRATPVATLGMLPFNTICDYEIQPVPGIQSIPVDRKPEPPEITLSGAGQATGKLFDITLSFTGIWPMKGTYTCGGTGGPKFIEQLRSDLFGFGTEIERTVIEGFCLEHIAELDVVTMQIIDGGNACLSLLKTEAVRALLSIFFDTVGPFLTYKDPVPIDVKRFDVNRAITSTYNASIAVML